MKKTICLILLLTCIASTYAQTDSTSTPEKEKKKQLVKISPFVLYYKFAFHYELQLNTKSSVQISPAYYYDFHQESAFLNSAFKLELAYRYYLNNHAELSGWYLYAKTGFSYAEYKVEKHVTVEGILTKSNIDQNRSSGGIGGGIGFQKFLGKEQKWFFDAGIGGQYWPLDYSNPLPENTVTYNSNAVPVYTRYYSTAANDWIILGPGSFVNVQFRIGCKIK